MELPAREPFFYCPALVGDVVLSGDDAHHMTVQRLRAGDRITLFDGVGGLAHGVIQKIGRSEARVRVEARRQEPAPVRRLDLYSAVPKGDRMAVLLDMATQLGMTRFTPIRWQRSVTEPGERAPERWRRICLEACKQSRRAHLPEIAPLLTPSEALARIRAARDALIVAHPGADSTPLARLNPASADTLALVVGPEGGLTNEEVEILRTQNACFVALGPRVLRIETAAVALLCAAQVLTDEN